VEEFAVNGAERPALFTDPLRWKLIIFDWAPTESKPSMVIHFGPGTRRLFSMDFDGSRKSITLIQSKAEGLIPLEERGLRPVPPKVGELIVNDKEPGRLDLEGEFEGRRVRAILHQTAPPPTTRKWRYRWFHAGPSGGTTSSSD
jgi:hypothetical protein